MSLKLQQITEDIADIKESLNQKDSNQQTKVYVFYELPIDSFKSFENFESFLGNTSEYKKFVCYLQKNGGNLEYECVKKTYSRIIKNEIACEYNCPGLKGKKALREFLLAKASVALKEVGCDPGAHHSKLQASSMKTVSIQLTDG